MACVSDNTSRSALILENVRLRINLLDARVNEDRLKRELRANAMLQQRPIKPAAFLNMLPCNLRSVLDFCSGRSLLRLESCCCAFFGATIPHLNKHEVYVEGLMNGDRPVTIHFDGFSYEGYVEDMPIIPSRFAIQLHWIADYPDGFEDVVAKVGRVTSLHVWEGAISEGEAYSLATKCAGLSSLELHESANVGRSAQEILAVMCNTSMSRLILDLRNPVLTAYMKPMPRSIHELSICGHDPQGNLVKFLGSCRRVQRICLPSFISKEGLMTVATCNPELRGVDASSLSDALLRCLLDDSFRSCLPTLEVLNITSEQQVATVLKILERCAAMKVVIISNETVTGGAVSGDILNMCQKRNIDVLEEPYMPEFIFLGFQGSHAEVLKRRAFLSRAF